VRRRLRWGRAMKARDAGMTNDKGQMTKEIEILQKVAKVAKGGALRGRRQQVAGPHVRSGSRGATSPTLIALAFFALQLISHGQGTLPPAKTGTVSVDANTHVVVAPADFWLANSNEVNSVVAPGASSGTAVKVNGGSSLATANLIDSAQALVRIASGNVTFYPTNLAAAQLSPTALIALTQLAQQADQTILGNNSGGSATPSALTTLPNGVQDNITRLGTVTSGSLDAARIASGIFSAARLPTNAVQQKVWVFAGATNLGTFGSMTIWPGANITLVTTNGAGNTNIDVVISSTGGGGGGTVPSGTGFEHVTGGVEDGTAVGETGSGNVVRATSPTLVTPTLGAATATTINGTTIPASVTLTKTTDNLSVFAATTSAQLAGVLSDETGSGASVFANTPTLVTPVLGAATATTINGTTIPSSATLARTADNLSVFAATTSAQLAGILSDETGSGASVFANSPTIVTPTIASFVNATHNHQSAAGGGALDAAAVTSGVFAIGRLATGTPDGTKFVRDDGTLAVPAGGSGHIGEGTFDGGSFPLTAGLYFDIIPASTKTVTRIRIDGDVSGNLTVDILHCTWAQNDGGYPNGGTHPVLADSITTGGSAPAVSGATKAEVTSFAGWASTTFTSGDLYRVIITGSPTVIKKAKVFID
jgi:hypothetical protein